jgi:hypothetical protein
MALWEDPMAKTAYKTEYLLRDVERALNAQLEAMLATVEARWADTDPIALPMPTEISVGGFDADVLNYRVEDFPKIALLGAPRTPDPMNAGQGKFALATHAIVLEWIFIAPTRKAATLGNMRYAEAILAIVHKIHSPEFHGFSPETPASTVEEQPGMPFYGPDPNQETPLAYMAGCTATVPVRGSISF